MKTLLFCTTLLFAFFCNQHAFAQSIGTPFTKNIIDSGQRKELPELKPTPKAPDLTLPSVQPPAKREQLSDVPSIQVSQFKFVGNTVFNDEELSQIANAYTNRRVTTDELHELRYKLTEHYISRGFINSGAVLPNQKVINNTITFAIIEGRLTEVQIINKNRIRDPFIIKRLQSKDDSPLNVYDLQERLQILHENKIINKVNGELLPGLKRGEAILQVAVEERKPVAFSVQTANNRSPSSGGIRHNATTELTNLSGWGDSISLTYGYMEGSDDYSAKYLIPLNSRDTNLHLFYSQSSSEIIEEPFSLVDISSSSRRFGITVSHPVIKSPTKEFNISFIGEVGHSETKLLGQSYSFSPGAVDGVSDVSVLRLSLDWLQQEHNQVIAARSLISYGIDILDATNSTSGPDGKFLAWLGQFQLAKRLDIIKNDQAIFRTDLQLAYDPLLPLEKFSIGGASSVRGYRENYLVMDNGIVSSFEYRFPIFRLPLPKLSKTLDDGIVQLAPFADWGLAWNTKMPTPHPNTIASYGIGIRWAPAAKMYTWLYFGKALRNGDPPEHNLQDSGIHFLLRWDLF